MRKGKSNWPTVGYIPIERPRISQTSGDQQRLRAVRQTLLQRCLAVLMNDLITANVLGASVTLAQHGTLLAVPRVVLYAADQPEERHVLGMQGNRCRFPCSVCMSRSENLASARSAASARDVLSNLEVQMDGALLPDEKGGAVRLAQIVRHSSALPYVPVLGAMHGLGTGDLALFNIFGFDMLHVRILVPIFFSCARKRAITCERPVFHRHSFS